MSQTNLYDAPHVSTSPVSVLRAGRQEMNIDLIPKYVWIGLKDMHWYERCEAVIVEVFGREKLELVATLLAATSINTSLKANVTLFRKALHEMENGKPIGSYLPNIQQQLRQVRAGLPLTGRKINSFARAMSGDKDAVVVDIWLLRAFSMDRKYKRSTGPHTGLERSSGATDREYSLIEGWCRAEAAKRGIEARQLSAMIWSGVRITQSGDTETNYIDFLRTSFQNLFNCI